MNPTQSQSAPIAPTSADVNTAGNNFAQINPLDITGGFTSPYTPEEANSPAGGQVELGERGRSGTYIFSGIITQEEYNADLIRQQALWNYDVMRRSDATVKQLLTAVTMPLLGTQWSIQAASEDDRDVMMANFIRRELFGRRIIWTDFLREAALMLPMGFSVFEKVLEWTDYVHTPAPLPPDPDAEPVFDNNGKEITPDPIQPPDKNMKLIGLAKLASRKQRSIYKWEMSNGEPGVHQILPGANYDIPWDKLVIFTNEKEGDNYEGISILRAAYKHWYLKDKMYLIDAIKIEKQSLGIVEVVPPEGADEDQVKDAVEAAQQLRANEMAYFKHPAGWTFEFMDMKAHTTVDTWPSIEHHDRAITKTFLAMFLELGHSTGSGSHALSRDHSQLFEKAVEAVCKNIAATVQHYIIQPLIDLNFKDVSDYPTIQHGRIHDDQFDIISTGIAALVTAGALTMDPELEQWIRNMAGAPDVPDSYKEDYENRPSNKTAPTTIVQQPLSNNKDDQAGPQNDDPLSAEPDPNGTADNSANNNTEVTANEAVIKANQAKQDLLKALGAIDAQRRSTRKSA